MRRVAIGRIYIATNTFNPVPVTLADVEMEGLATGPEVMLRYGEEHELGGFQSLPDLLREPVQWVGLVRALTWPGGPLAKELADWLLGAIRDGLDTEPVDGVLLSLHGATASEGDPDFAGQVLCQVRELVGPAVPIVATLDLHANLTRRMVEAADTLVGYHTFPHEDQVSTGRRAAQALHDIWRVGERPQVHAIKMPFVTGGDGQLTDTGILTQLWGVLPGAEAQPGMLSIGLYQPHPWLDAPELGWTLYQSCCCDVPALKEQAVRRACWQTRAHRGREYLSPVAAVAAALALPAGPVVIGESHDALTAGAPGDNTHLAAALAAGPVPGGALAYLVDPEAVAACAKAGVGARLPLTVGGRRDPYSEPLPLEVTVRAVDDVRLGAGSDSADFGRGAVVQSDDLTLILTERRGPAASPALALSLGLDPASFRILAVKGGEVFREAYAASATAILDCHAPGCANPELSNLTYRRASRPLYPLDDLEEPPLAAWAGDMVHPCHCSVAAAEAEAGCGGCGRCCGREPTGD